MQRQWRLVERLHGLTRGLPVRTLLEELKISRSTFYRYRDTLIEAGFPIDNETQNGEKRYRLLGKALPAVRATALQAQALRLARRLLTPLEGTEIIRELDGLLPDKDAPASRKIIVDAPPPPPLGDPAIITAIEQAMLQSKRIEFTYASTSSEPGPRIVDPLALYVSGGHLYLESYDVKKAEVRTLKIVRMSDMRVLDQPAQPHPEYNGRQTFAHTAKIWDGPLVDVVVRISPRGARFVSEWPLVSSQQIDPQPDGSVLVRAGVCGTVETMRWVLRWGKDAQVIEPAELRTAVVNELLNAVAAYAGAVVSDV